MKTISLLVLTVMGCLMLSGCTGEAIPETVNVSGTITKKGKPLEGILVKFMPDGSKGNSNLRTSTGETDASGRYELTYQLPGQNVPGAAVGPHKVVMEDMKVNDGRTEDSARTRKSRISTELLSSTTTELEANLAPGQPAVCDFNVN